VSPVFLERRVNGWLEELTERQERVMNSMGCRICAVFVAIAGLQPVLGQGRGVPGGIAFSSARDGNNEIYVMDWDGRRPLRLTDDAASDLEPDISPDGRDVVFTSARSGNNDIHVMSSNGGPAVDLTNNTGNDGWARWSPNGRHIAFHSNRDGNFEIYVMNADGSGQTRVTNYPGVDQYPDWSPPLNQMPAWSPNGKQLVFMSSRAGYPSVFSMNADGSNQHNLTPKNPGDLDADWISRAPSWSTNGRQIYFMSSRPSTGLDAEIFIMNADGSGATRLTSSIGMDGIPRAR
jgi:TolB protein